mgnify:CR=1 FL=1
MVACRIRVRQFQFSDRNSFDKDLVSAEVHRMRNAPTAITFTGLPDLAYQYLVAQARDLCTEFVVTLLPCGQVIGESGSSC